MESAEIPNNSETELRAKYAELQQRARHLEVHGPSRIEQLYEAMQVAPAGHAAEYVGALKGATTDAMLAIQNYHAALPFLETANSLIESLAKPPTFADGMEWHDELLYRLSEVLETAAEIIAEGEARVERSSRVTI